jgi:hypothetical protein
MKRTYSVVVSNAEWGILYYQIFERWRESMYTWEYSLCKISISYGLIFFVGGGGSESSKVLIIQKRMLCLIKGVKIRSSCRPIFKELKILTVTALYIFEVLYFLRKHNLHIMKNLGLHEYNTRRKDDLHVQKCNTLTCKKGLLIWGINCIINWCRNWEH